MGGSTTHVLGVDGCPGGWIVVVARDGRFSRLATYPSVESIVDAHPDASVIGIDIPLSFPDGSEPRAADAQARRRLGGFGASLFLTPPRDVLEIEDYAAANAHSRAQYARGISRQSYALRAKVLEAVRFVERTGETRLCEVHPELSFRLLAESQGTAISYRKKLWSGAVERFRLLDRVGLAPPLDAHDALGKAAVDDVLDASVAAWSAHRIAQGTARRLGEADGHRGKAGIIFA